MKRVCWILGLALVAMVLPALQIHAQEAVFAEKGRDVGDGQVLYETPYDPKTVSEVTFVSPTVEHPYYEIVLPLGDWSEGKGANLKGVSVSGVESDSFYVFVDGFAHVQSGWVTQDSETAPNLVVVTRSLWHNNEATDIAVTITRAEGDPVVREFHATAPASGGGPEGWRRYQSFVLHETAGLYRESEPVEFSVAARKEDCADLAKEVRLYKVDSANGALGELPVQVFNVKRFEGRPPGTDNPNYLQHPSQSCEAVFLATVPANSAAVYVVAYDNPGAGEREVIESDLTVTGPSLGATVENKHFIVRLDEKSGQIASFDVKGREENPVPRLTNSYSSAVHWNPDSFSDNGLWGHTFAWDPPDSTVVTARGPIMFRVTNSGRMPASTPQVHSSVTYTFYAGVPYVKVSTVTEARDKVNISAIRNGEIVLDSHLVTHFVWQDDTGEVKTIRTLHGPNWQDEWAARVDHDVPWLAMTNEHENYGLGEIVTSSVSFNAASGMATTHRPAFYLYYHHFWQIPVTYFTRAWVYPFSDYQRGPIIPVDAGSTYVNQAAFLPFYLGEGGSRYEAIIDASRELQTPLAQRWGR